jgi:hypothetical protein
MAQPLRPRNRLRAPRGPELQAQRQRLERKGDLMPIEIQTPQKLVTVNRSRVTDVNLPNRDSRATGYLLAMTPEVRWAR